MVHIGTFLKISLKAVSRVKSGTLVNMRYIIKRRGIRSVLPKVGYNKVQQSTFAQMECNGWDISAK